MIGTAWHFQQALFTRISVDLLCPKQLTPVIPVLLDIPVGIRIFGVVLLVTGDFDLLETPLRQVDIGSPEPAIQRPVSETHSCCQCMHSAVQLLLRTMGIVDDLHYPKIVVVADSHIPIRCDFPMFLCDWGSDWVRVQIASG